MKRERQLRKTVIGLAVLLTLGMTLGGCTALQSRGQAGGTDSVAAQDKDGAPLYYDFGDVLIPSEMKVDKKASFVYRTPGFSAGVLSLRGRVDSASLIGFFESNMVKDNWQVVSSFKSVRSILLFHKDNRWCVVNITEKDIYTYTEIWVAPTTVAEGTNSGTDLFK
jgi:hypothetical protein